MLPHAWQVLRGLLESESVFWCYGLHRRVRLSPKKQMQVGHDM